jgi:hypothetical protein
MPRGRKSEAAQFQGGPFIPAQRPEPPADLQPEEAKGEWRRIVNRMPTEWFTEENFALLSELCAHIAYAKEVRAEIEAVKEACAAEGKRWGLDAEWRAKVGALLAEHRYQSQQIASLATKLRLPIQSRYSPRTAEDEREKVAATVGRKPWEWREDVRQ